MAGQAGVPAETVVLRNEEQWIFTEEEIVNSPSVQHGMTPAEEHELRKKAIHFINQVGIAIKVPQLTLYTASIFLNRFFMRNSLKQVSGYPKPLHHYQIGAVALFIASKVDENARKTKDFVVACCRTALKKPNLLVDEQTKDFWKWRDTILNNEDVMYEALCFDFTITSPHRLLVDILKDLGVEHHKMLRQSAWSFLNDSALTTLGIRFTSTEVAASAVFAALKFCDLDPLDPTKQEGTEQAQQETNGNGSQHNGKPAPKSKRQGWWALRGVKLARIKEACNYMADMYKDGKESADGGTSMYAGLKTPVDEAVAAKETPGIPESHPGTQRGETERSAAKDAEQSPAVGSSHLNTKPDEPESEEGEVAE